MDVTSAGARWSAGPLSPGFSSSGWPGQQTPLSIFFCSKTSAFSGPPRGGAPIRRINEFFSEIFAQKSPRVSAQSRRPDSLAAGPH
jgi:hypothetical protein